MSGTKNFVSLGMFIIDEFAFLDAAGKPTGRTLPPQEQFPLPRLQTLVRLSYLLYFRLGEAELMPPLALAYGWFDLPRATLSHAPKVV
jgi:hypothetical protein